MTFVIAYLVDKYGRKLTLYLGAVFMLAGSLLGGFAQNVGQLMGSRVLLGVGTAAARASHRPQPQLFHLPLHLVLPFPSQLD
jgi:MFS family permease